MELTESLKILIMFLTLSYKEKYQPEAKEFENIIKIIWKIIRNDVKGRTLLEDAKNFEKLLDILHYGTT